MIKFSNMKKLFIFFIIFIVSCSKTENVVNPVVSVIKEDPVKFDLTQDVSSGVVYINSDSLLLNINISSNLPTAGVNCLIEIKRIDTSLITFRLDTNITQKNLNINTTGFNIKAGYTAKIIITSKSTSTNTSSLSFSINRNRVYKNYLKTSYELSNFDTWFSSLQLYKSNGSRYLNNPFIDEQSTQIDIDGDGQEDLFYYEGYDLNISPTPNPPPSVFINTGTNLKQQIWNGPNLKEPHGTKILVGDFNNDSLPDLFSLVAVDPPNSSPAGFLNTFDICNLLINSPNGFTKVNEYPDQGFWYSGCSGDIDNDGDLDIIAFNFHNQTNGVKSRIMWNDGKANFTKDYNGIGTIPVVDQSELCDINKDGKLDLIINFHPNGLNRINDFRILWGNGSGFSLSNSLSIDMPGDWFLQNLDFVDIDGDGFKEIIPSGNYNSSNGTPIYFVSIYKTDDNGKTFLDKTLKYIDNNTASRFFHIRVQDIDKNGLIDIFSGDKKDNIRWEWNGSKFIKK